MKEVLEEGLLSLFLQAGVEMAEKDRVILAGGEGDHLPKGQKKKTPWISVGTTFNSNTVEGRDVLLRELKQYLAGERKDKKWLNKEKRDLPHLPDQKGK